MAPSFTKRSSSAGHRTVPDEDQAVARRLGDVLVEREVLTRRQLTDALEGRTSAPSNRRRLGHLVVDHGYATERQVAEALADLLELPFLDLDRSMVNETDALVLPRMVAEQHGLLVLSNDPIDGLVIATADPKNPFAFDDVRLHTRIQRISVRVAAESQVREIIESVWAGAERAKAVSAVAEDSAVEEVVHDEVDIAAAQDAPIITLTNRLIGDAIRARASDIHVEPQRDGVRVRYRVDGVLRDVTQLPASSRGAVTSRLKLIAGMDIAERRVPQDGRVQLEVSGRSIDARVSSLPSMHGEKVVIRLLTPSDHVPDLDQLGFDDKTFAIVSAALEQPQGLVLITGPTGSGKTNTLFSALREINTPERNIVTLEDPVEIQLPGITQVQVNERTGLTFARGLRSILRQDPDVVLVGEIRDIETAELAMRASMTGHLVLATLHTNDAVSALTRLVDMGVEPFLVASSLSLVIAQRLVRTNCPECSAPWTPDPDTLAALGVKHLPKGATPRRGIGCTRCENSGYLGRQGLFEVVSVTPAMRRALLSDPTESVLSDVATKAGTTSLRAAGLAAAQRGATTYEEALRVTIRQGSDD